MPFILLRVVARGGDVTPRVGLQPRMNNTLKIDQLFRFKTARANPVLTESGFALFSLCGRIFLTANRYPPPDQVRGHASPENALDKEIFGASSARSNITSIKRIEQLDVPMAASSPWPRVRRDRIFPTLRSA
jgi:hypothetical protein